MVKLQAKVKLDVKATAADDKSATINSQNQDVSETAS